MKIRTSPEERDSTETETDLRERNLDSDLIWLRYLGRAAARMRREEV